MAICTISGDKDVIDIGFIQLCKNRLYLVTSNTSKSSRAFWVEGKPASWRFLSTYGINTLSRYRKMVSSFDQWFGVCHTSHSAGKVKCGWQRSVFPSYNSCGGSTAPVAEIVMSAVISFLSSVPAMETRLLPDNSIVQSELGTRRRAVWSQLKMKLSGIFPLATFAVTSSRKVFFHDLKLCWSNLGSTRPLSLNKVHST